MLQIRIVLLIKKMPELKITWLILSKPCFDPHKMKSESLF
jgi:hypothetical protein